MAELLVGVDEVGRGCLAGPVVAAAVILPKNPPKWVQDIRDSKKLSAKKREVLAALILDTCVYYISETDSQTIDDVNILNATLLTMRKAIEGVCSQGYWPDLVLVDGNREIPELPMPQKTIKGGDDLYKEIGAASIIAKVYRDNLMKNIHLSYPEYGFEKHKGYGTAQHRQAIMEHGVTPLHRRTFRGVFEYV